MNVIFAGTPVFAARALERIAASSHRVRAVYTQPDRPAGRGQRVQESAVKQRALALDLPVFQPEKMRGNEPVVAQLRSQAPDVMVVAAYGLILPAAVLAVPRLGCINIHASLLPRWRGAAPIQRAILAGDRMSGVTIMQMDEGLDTGAMLATTECVIADNDTGLSLHDKLAELGAEAVVDVLDRMERGPMKGQAQDPTHACYAAKVDKKETLIDWSTDAVAISRKIRAFNAWPVARTVWRDQPMLLYSAEAVKDDISAAIPGRILALGDNGIVIGTGRGKLCVTELQLSGKRRMQVVDFLRSGMLRCGDQLG